jgi:RNA polymerase sigma factor (sigma-70 family)
MDTRAPDAAHAAVDRHVTALYQAHALSLARLALLMLGDRDAAQDVVQDAFLGLYRRWDKLASADAAPAYLRASVLNSCRTLLKQRPRTALHAAEETLESAEAAMMHTEEQRAMLAAIRRLPARQRETLVLRYYLDMSEDPGRAGDGGQPRHRQVRHVPGHRRHRPDAQGGIMSALEDEIRDTLRSEAARLREVSPLQLPPAAAVHEPRAVPRAPGCAGSAPGKARRWPWL